MLLKNVANFVLNPVRSLGKVMRQPWHGEGKCPNKLHTSKTTSKSSVYILKSQNFCFGLGLSITRESQSSRAGVDKTLPNRHMDYTFFEKNPFRAMSPTHG